MSGKNPYEDFDAIDPWDEDTDIGYDDSDVGLDKIPDMDDLPSLSDYRAELSAYTPTDAAQRGPAKTMVRKAPIYVSPADRTGYAGGVYEPEPSMAPQVRRGRTPRRRRRRRRHGCLTTIVLFAGIFAVVYWAVFHPIDEKLALSDSERETVGSSLSWSVPGMPYYVLALGSDARSGEVGARTDTMVLARVDFVGGKLTLLSIPRDTKVEIAGYGTQKINAAYAYGGVGGAVDAVSELCGVPISHVAVVRFEELVGLVDYLGGVTVNVPTAISDPMTGVVLDAGMQTMDGTTALLWARSRYGYERGDFERQDNQRILITAIMNRMLSLSPRELPGAFEHVGDFVGTDLRCYNLIPLFVRFRLANPQIYSASIPSTTAMIDGVSYVIVDEGELSRLMQVVNAGEDPSSV